MIFRTKPTLHDTISLRLRPPGQRQSSIILVLIQQIQRLFNSFPGSGSFVDIALQQAKPLVVDFTMEWETIWASDGHNPFSNHLLLPLLTGSINTIFPTIHWYWPATPLFQPSFSRHYLVPGNSGQQRATAGKGVKHIRWTSVHWPSNGSVPSGAVSRTQTLWWG